MTEIMIEKIAVVLCSNEVWGNLPRNLDVAADEVARTWRRFIPGAEELVRDLSKAGIVVLMPAKMPETSNGK